MRSPAEEISAKPVRLLVLLGLGLLLSGNWLLPLMDRDEPKFAEASREMLQRGDYVTPRFNGQYRFDKPPLIYWCQAGAYKIFGQNAFAARLPSVLFATATAAVLWLWGRRIGEPRAGVYAGMIFLTCLQVLIHGRLAVADMPMILFVTTAAWSGWEITRPQTSGNRFWWWMFYLSLGFGFLAKGPVAWLPLLGLLAGRTLRPSLFRLRPWRVLAGLLLTTLVIGLWGVPALVATRGEFFTVGIGRHVVFRSLGILEGHGGAGWIGFVLTLPLYLATFFFSFFPWSLRFPAALRAWWDSRKASQALEWYLLLQAALVFAVFTLVRTKLPHYTLPAFPVLSLWLALQISRQPAAGAWVFQRTAAMGILALVITMVVFPLVRPWFIAAALYQQARPLCSPGMAIATVGFDEPSLVWEFRRTTTNFLQHLNLEQAARFLNQPGPRMVILPENDFSPTLQDAATNTTSFHVVGLDTASFRRIKLGALLKAAN